MEKVMFKRRFTEEQRVKYVNEVLESGSNVLIAKKMQSGCAKGRGEKGKSRFWDSGSGKRLA